MFLKQSHLRRYAVTLAVSYMEIYKDEVYDLLVTRENVRAQIYVFVESCLWLHPSFSIVRLHLCGRNLLVIRVGSEASGARERPGQSVCRQSLQRTYLLRGGVRRPLCVRYHFIKSSHI